MTINDNPTAGEYAPGWYPDAMQPGFERWYDGTAWTAQTRAAESPESPTPATPKKGRKGWIIGGSIAAGIIVLGSAMAAGAGAGTPSDARAGSVDSTRSTAASSAPAAEKIDVPDVVGMTVVEAKTTLTAAGFVVSADAEDADIVTGQSATELVAGGTVMLQAEPAEIDVPDVVGKTASDAAAALQAAGLDASYEGDDSAIVTAQAVKAGTPTQRGTVVALTLQPPMTRAQENAVQSAQQYIDRLGGFSKKSLIEQLKYEQFSTADAKFAVEHITVDWKEQAAQKAEQYIDLGGFSKGSLRDQLEYEGFTDSQISYALKSVGY